MFKRVLIANRGEIALRVQRSCRELGIETVAVYSDPDRSALHVRRADAAVHIGPGPAAQSYLVIERVIDAARSSGAEAIHPGYGFLSENPAFAAACEKAGLAFIGPPASAMQAMGDKVAARRLMEESGVPVVPGAHDIDIGDVAGAMRAAEGVGFPLLVKAASGGGGRGIRLVESAGELEQAMRASSREAEASFADGTVFLERYLEPRVHLQEIEVSGAVHQKFDGAAVAVPATAGGGHGGVAQARPQLRGHRHRGRLLDELLVPALDGAFALAVGAHVAVVIGDDLHLNVASRLQVTL